EAPRGILYHRYELDADGTILDAKIVPPTSQNQRTIEEDLHGVVERSLELPEEELTLLCEKTIRNYDPCISCATHFLKLEIHRSCESFASATRGAVTTPPGSPSHDSCAPRPTTGPRSWSRKASRLR